jgi:uncharacterized protein
MYFLLSPAKSLDYETAVPEEVPHTQPQFVKQSAELIGLLKTQSRQQIAQLMNLSDDLATKNVARYKAWSSKFTTENSKQAMLAFDGAVYDGLYAINLKTADLVWAQQHVGMLSGLYGLLRPLDYMQPYRLEMGTRLPNAKGSTLYSFWGDQIADQIIAHLAADKEPIVVNLASHEYFKSVDRKALKARVVECVFEEHKPAGYKVVGFYAKRARGMMARYAIQKRITTVKKLTAFNAEGYMYAEAASEPDRLVFRRKL